MPSFFFCAFSRFEWCSSFFILPRDLGLRLVQPLFSWPISFPRPWSRFIPRAKAWPDSRSPFFRVALMIFLLRLKFASRWISSFPGPRALAATRFPAMLEVKFSGFGWIFLMSFCWISSSTFLISRSGARERGQLCRSVGGRASLQVSGSSFPALVSHLALKFVFRRRLVSAAEAAGRFGFQLPFSFHCRRFFIRCEIFLRWSKQCRLRFLRLGSRDELILPPESAGAVFFAAWFRIFSILIFLIIILKINLTKRFF
jgi:hypothetical protein